MRQIAGTAAPKKAGDRRPISLSEMQARIDALAADLKEARDQQSAATELLQVINASAGDLAPVFDAMLQKATRLCDAASGIFWIYDGERFRAAAFHGLSPETIKQLRNRQEPIPTAALAAIARGEKVVRNDVLRGTPGVSFTTNRDGMRTGFLVALRKGDKLLGAIRIFRQEERPFSDQQIALVQNFAAQAVIAMENARLITETHEALERQTATAEVLQVINSSPGDLAPVFDAMLERAVRLCEFDFSTLWTFDGSGFHPVARHGVPERFWHYLLDHTPPAFARILEGEPLVHIPDLRELPVFTQSDFARQLRELGIAPPRALLIVPLRQDDALLGVVVAYRHEARPFSDRQIGLLRNFAAQAVIAMENARLLNELRTRTHDLQESLEYQTATSDVLEVISRSTFDLQPVLDTVCQTAMRLCEAEDAIVFRLDEGLYHAIAVFGFTPEHKDYLRGNPLVPNRGTVTGRTGLERRIVHVADVESDPEYTWVEGQQIARFRTALGVPMLRDDTLLGVIFLSRSRVIPFSDRQIELVRTFAAQAVIAIENARLITETREALEQQTATAEVLGVINSSPGDLPPVFDAMLEKAHSLCGIAQGSLELYDGERFRAVAVRGLSDTFADMLRHGYPASDNPATRPLLEGKRFTHIRDLAETEYSITRSSVELDAARTLLCVPLRRDNTLLGMIACARKEVRPFSEKEIALLENFAAQAVIAIENGRLITETREALEQQTATAEVLQVINSSPGDLTPVFDAMLERAVQLCEAHTGHLLRYEDGEFNRAASFGGLEDFDKIMPRHQPLVGVVTRDSVPFRTLATRAAVHVLDTAKDESYRAGAPAEVAGVQAGIRTTLFVPLLREGKVIGNFVMHRREKRPFTDKQIALVQNFAAQAVIAIENARLITETREALEQQTATAEVLQVINSSPGDLAPVFDAILEKAHSLCQAAFGSLFTYDGKFFHGAASHGLPEAIRPERRGAFRPGVHNPLSELARGEPLAHVPDMRELASLSEPTEPGHLQLRAAVEQGGIRTMLMVPLRKDGALLGVISAYRQEVRPFTDKQIALLQNFAAQAVIAMENARLITETREALEQQTATTEVLQVINASPGDLAPVFDAMLEKATTLCEAAYGTLFTYDGECFHAVALRGVPAAFAQALGTPVRADPGAALYRIERGERFAHFADVANEAAYRGPAGRVLVELGGARSALAVPLRKDGALLGAFAIYRQEVRPFSDKQIALLQNFAAQAVIAMENARLITETREALEQQTATADILRIISGSATDVQPVFEAIVERAIKLCEAEFAGVARFDADGLLRLVATSNLSTEEAAAFHSLFPRPANRGFVMGRAFIEGQPVNVEDVLSDPDYDQRTQGRLLSATRYRSFLGVPMLRDGKPIGVIGCARRRVKAFTAAEIEVLRTFADQAVIAIENVRLLAELRDREAELRVTFDNMGDGVAMFDADLHLAAWNRNFQQILDVPEGLLAGRPTANDFIRHLAEHGEFGTVDVEAEVRRLSERMGQEWSTERTRPDGRVIEVRNNPVPGGGFVLIYSDITDRKRSEEETRAARDAAEAALRDLKAAQANLIQAEKMASLGQLTAGIAHEIKNPLNFVNNFAGLSVELLDELKETAAPAIATLEDDKRADIDETVEMLTSNLEKIAEHGRRADNIVKSMLEHSRGVTGERRQVDLNGLVDEALNLAYHGARAQDQGFNITLERRFAADLAPIELAPQEVTRVFLNLFGNGFYATAKRQRDGGEPDFRPTLTVSTRERADKVEIRVRDNGTGIPPEIKDKLFQPFFTTKPTGEGTGLGLSISYDIVTQQHGGAIEIDSQVGQFTEFTITLPRRASPTIRRSGPP